MFLRRNLLTGFRVNIFVAFIAMNVFLKAIVTEKKKLNLLRGTTEWGRTETILKKFEAKWDMTRLYSHLPEDVFSMAKARCFCRGAGTAICGDSPEVRWSLEKHRRWQQSGR
jgi:hypothetical protein